MKGPIRHVLLDIEGTTCPLAFVSEVLFPYAQSQLPQFLSQHQDQDEVQRLRVELLASWSTDAAPEARELLQMERQRHPAEANCSQLPAEALVPYLQWLNRHNRKLTAWKDLQGLIWEAGYRAGDLQANLYPDAAEMLRRWHDQGLQLSVYSSGSVAAQKLLYGHTSEGDLTALFSHWFDTRIGLKNQSESYRRILEVIGCPAREVLFISDVRGELEAAASLGIQCLLSDRPDTGQQDPGGFGSISSFSEVRLDTVVTGRE